MIVTMRHDFVPRRSLSTEPVAELRIGGEVSKPVMIRDHQQGEPCESDGLQLPHDARADSMGNRRDIVQGDDQRAIGH